MQKAKRLKAEFWGTHHCPVVRWERKHQHEAPRVTLAMVGKELRENDVL